MEVHKDTIFFEVTDEELLNDVGNLIDKFLVDSDLPPNYSPKKIFASGI